VPINRPTPEQLRRIAGNFGITLTDDALSPRCSSFTDLIDEGLANYETVDQEWAARAPQPPSGAWHRPSPEDNRLGAWAARTEITEPDQGPLAGKRLAIKNNVAVVGLPIANGSKTLDAYIADEAVAAGEPLNPEVIEQVRRAWGVTIRDGFGQTETAVQVSNSPGQQLKTGSMGRPSPGFRVVLLDPVSGAPGAEEGEIALDMSGKPVGLMTGYHGDADRTAEAALVPAPDELELGELPKTVSGKIRRIELREPTAVGSDAEYREEDFR
jgi:acyl-CoA synthetase (AMP-forming)/AMP-acid ligase II